MGVIRLAVENCLLKRPPHNLLMPRSPNTFLMKTAAEISPEDRESVLTDDQARACARLLTLARVRSGTVEAALPVGVLRRWSVPLLIGPAGSGKAFVCEEVARRWNGKPCRRWEVGSWRVGSSRGGHTTPEQIRAFVADHPAGCVVYLAGVDALAVEAAHNASYFWVVESEITQILDHASARPAYFSKRDGTTVRANVLVVVGGCFGTLWGDATIGGPEGGEAWRLADAEPLVSSVAVAKWLTEHSRLPTGILRRLSPEPLVLRPIDREQADQIAGRLRDSLPPSLDGLDADEFSHALQGPCGWRAVAAVVERGWVAAHEPLSGLEADLPKQPSDDLAPELSEESPPADLRPEPVGMRLGIPFPRTRLIAKAQKLDLHTASDLEWLAYARGYRFSGEDQTDTMAKEKVGRDEFSDLELTLALLSPYLPWNERAICRGAVLLVAQLPVTAPGTIANEARRARAELIVRHVAWLAVELRVLTHSWYGLLRLLPTSRRVAKLKPGVMPDAAIRGVLRALGQS